MCRTFETKLGFVRVNVEANFLKLTHLKRVNY